MALPLLLQDEFSIVTALDYWVFGVYLAGIVALGAWFARRQKSGREFFLAGRSMHWLPLGLSVMVTAFSAINYSAFSGEVFQNGLYVALALPMFLLVAWPVTRVVMPFFYGMELCSAYEYLERRFDVRVRCLASGLFMLWRMVWMATALYATCKVMSVVTGWPLTPLLWVGGVAATLYTLLGGMRAVMWTDVAQFCVVVGGIAAAIAVAAFREPLGLSGLFQGAVDAGLARPLMPFDASAFSFDPRLRITFWSCLVGATTIYLARYSVDQVVVQRYFAARSLAQARRGFWLNTFCAMTVIGSLAVLGFAVHAHVVREGLSVAPGAPPTKYLALFIRSMPTGVCGLIVAGLLAATMSSVDSGVNSCAAAYWTDFHQRFRGGSEEGGRQVRVCRVVSLLIGLCVIGLACYVGTLRQSVFVTTMRLINGLGSPLLVIFALGMFSRRATATAVFRGGVVGVAFSLAFSLREWNLAVHYYAVVNLLATLALCGAAMALGRLRGEKNTSDQLAWLWMARRGKNGDA